MLIKNTHKSTMEHKVIEKELPRNKSFKDAATITRNWFLQLKKQHQQAGKAKIKKVREGFRSLGNISKFPMRSPRQSNIKIVESNSADIDTAKATKNNSAPNTQGKIMSTEITQNVALGESDHTPQKYFTNIRSWWTLGIDYLVIDTNVLISSLHDLLALINFGLPYQNGIPLNGIVYCPEVVFEELDKLKNSDGVNPDRAFRAREAINAIDKYLVNNPRFCGQSKSDQYFASKIPNFVRKTNDDEILQTCLYLMAGHKKKVHLLSYDHNLRNRARNNGIEISPITEEWESMSKYTKKAKIQENVLSNQSSHLPTIQYGPHYRQHSALPVPSPTPAQYWCTHYVPITEDQIPCFLSLAGYRVDHPRIH